MQVAYGLHFDNREPQHPRNTAGIVILGPAGLLGVLDTQRGLPSAAVHPCEAVSACLQCLR